ASLPPNSGRAATAGDAGTSGHQTDCGLRIADCGAAPPSFGSGGDQRASCVRTPLSASRSSRQRAQLLTCASKSARSPESAPPSSYKYVTSASSRSPGYPQKDVVITLLCCSSPAHAEER